MSSSKRASSDGSTMKIILTGATGFIGSEILAQCIEHRYIKHIFVLTRRPLAECFSHKKVTQLLHEDFETYPQVMMDALRDEQVDACIWALGPKAEDFKNLEEARKVGISYPVCAADAFARLLAPSMKPFQGYPEKKGPGVGERIFPFRFIFISAWGAEQNQFRRLWFWNDTRKIKGAAEKGIFDIADTSTEVEGHRCFEAIALRPGTVLPKGDTVRTVMGEAVSANCAVNRLANAAIRAMIYGTDKRILENKDCLGEDWGMMNSTSYMMPS